MPGTVTEDLVHESWIIRSSRLIAIRITVTALVLVIWFWTQSLIGSRTPPAGNIGDRVLDATESPNFYLHAHPATANLLLIVSSAIIDLLGVLLLLKWIFGASIRPFAALVIVMGLRQLMQWLVAIPAPPNAIWHYPGVPSLLVTYNVSNDYFFSAHTAIAVLGITELLIPARKHWLTAIGVLVAVFEIATVLVVRAHYTMDVFTGGVTALYASHLAGRLFSPPKTTG